MLEDLSAYSENNRLEAKEAKGGLPKSIWETYSAFANTAGGVILLGVEELADHSLNATGVKDPRKLLDDFWNAANDPTRVSAVVLTDSDVSVRDVDGNQVIAIHVPRADRRIKPVFLHGNPSHSFRRNHTGDYRCTIDEVRSMMRDAADESQDSKPLPRVRMDELNSKTVRAYRQLYNTSHEGHPWTDLSDYEFLRTIGAAEYTDDGELHPTGAGLIMFGEDWRITKEFPSYILDYRQQLSPAERWQDRVTSKSGEWSGNAYDFFFRVYNLARQALKTPFRLDGIHRVDDTPAHRALREALANCLVNANYTGRQGITVVWERDKITVSNPGDFRIDLERAKRGGRSDPRNQAMLNMFSAIDIGERAGSGIPRIIDGWISCGYDEPTWQVEFDPERTTLTLPLTQDISAAKEKPLETERAHKPGENAGINLQTFFTLEENEQSAIKLAMTNGRVTTAKLAEERGLTLKAARAVLRQLAEDGLLEWEGKSSRDPHQYYRIAGTD